MVIKVKDYWELPSTAEKILVNVEEDYILCFFGARTEFVNVVGSDIDNDYFTDAYCSECPYYHYNCEDLDDDGDPIYGECEGGVEFLNDDICEAGHHISDFQENIDNLKVDILPHIFATRLSAPPKYKLFLPSFAPEFELGIDEDKIKENTLYTIPFLFGNVHSDGEVCWNSTNKDVGAYDIGANYLAYWSASFNNDLNKMSETTEDLARWMENISFEQIVDCYNPDPSYQQFKQIDQCLVDEDGFAVGFAQVELRDLRTYTIYRASGFVYDINGVFLLRTTTRGKENYYELEESSSSVVRKLSRGQLNKLILGGKEQTSCQLSLELY